MPIKSSKSNKIISKDIKELVKSCNNTSKISSSKSANNKKVAKQPAATELNKTVRNKKKGKI
jgi:hypothetical protein